MSLAAVGDILSDQGPIQIGEFSPVRKLDDWLQRIWLEGNGGGQAKESYEFTAYYYARRCDLTNAKTPFFLITGDEGFRETLYANDLVRHFGGQHENVQATQVFAELDKKFNGNVFLIRRQYSGKENDEIQGQWERLLGKERVVPLKSDQAIADITLGVFALMTGARTLEEYLDDLKTKRAIPQTDERIEEVRQSLGMLAELQSKRVPVQAAATRPAPSLAQPPEEPPARKRGRIF